MKFSQLIKDLGRVDVQTPMTDFDVAGVACDSRRVKPGFVFVAVRGTCVDAAQFVPESVSRGARAVIVKSGGHQGLAPSAGVVIIEVADDRKALARCAQTFYADPSSRMKVVGVTGTNGKTTITYLIEAILSRAGCIPGVIGTINCRFNKTSIPAKNTTPGPLELQEMMAAMVKAKVSQCAMEVSSHALDQGRVDGIRFASAIFTNLTQDHLDYHKDLEDYFRAKAKLFTGLSEDARAVINVDDAYGRRLTQMSKGRLVTYGIDTDADVRATDIALGLSSCAFTLKTKNGTRRFTIKLIGKHNVYNALAAIAWAGSQGFDPAVIQKALEDFSLVPGRLEPVENDKGFSVFVDYAHTEDALKNVLAALRTIARKRIILVFGCGGDRDRAKRPKMGAVATELADFTIITSDNPRSEEPDEIIRDITRGIQRHNFSIIPERMDAIKKSLMLAGQGDVVLVAGKGHEAYQIIKDRVVHFDDKEAVKECLRSLSL